MADLIQGHVRHPAVGELVCGDGHLVYQGDTFVLVVVSDGLGHGVSASDATKALLACVEEQPGLPPLDLIQACHQRLKGTCGAAASFVRLEAEQGTMIHAGVGNVEARLITSGKVQRPCPAYGVLGERVRKFTTETFPYQAGDLLVVHTDGISDRFELKPEARHRDPQALARQLAHEHGKDYDDQLLLIVKEAP
ncbi:MAG: rsbX1 [Cyanobacteria bacterium RYN_339]|nr:rsbX1 [Cyanobacteria bacterium RYN_339]